MKIGLGARLTSILNSTDAKLAPQKLAPNLLFQAMRLICLGECHNPSALDTGNHFEGRGIFAHRHCSLHLDEHNVQRNQQIMDTFGK